MTTIIEKNQEKFVRIGSSFFKTFEIILSFQAVEELNRMSRFQKSNLKPIYD
jgi:hypothetical protein